MKRIFYVTRADLANSPYAEVTLPALARAGWELTVVGHNATRSCYRSSLPYPCQPIDLPDPRTERLAEEVDLVRRLITARVRDYDVLYVNSQSAGWRAALALVGPKLGKKLVYHNPDYYSPQDYPYYFSLEKSLCRKADLYINNEFHRGYITSVMYGARAPLITLPPNLPLRWPTPRRSNEVRSMLTGGERDAFVLIVHGGYSKLRMTPQLVQALARLPSRFRLVMTGRGDRRDEVDQVLAGLGLSERVVRLPNLPFNDLLSFTVNADAGVLLYANNDLGNFFTAPGRLTEYLLCDLPCLTADHTGLENLVLRYGLGVSADATRPDKLATAITQLAAKASAGKYPPCAMRRVFEAHFAFDHFEPTIVRAFDEMMKGTRSRDARPQFPWLPNQ